jgi:hypothetical protein
MLEGIGSITVTRSDVSRTYPERVENVFRRCDSPLWSAFESSDLPRADAFLLARLGSFTRHWGHSSNTAALAL